MKKMVCLITSIGFLSIQPFLRPLFSGQQELSKLDYYFQNGGKTGAQANQSFWKLNNIFWWSKISHIIIKGWNYMIKSFSGQIVFCFAILRAISAYVGENWLSQYINSFVGVQNGKAEQPVWTWTANGANKKVVLHVQLRCGSLSNTTLVSPLVNEFDVPSELHRQVSLAACVVHEAMNGCQILKIH